MSHAIEFIETPVFTRQIKEIATDEELQELQRDLIAQPDKGSLIENGGGLRKVRLATGSNGKSGSARVIYIIATTEVVYMLLAYKKGNMDNFTEAQKTQLRKLAKQLKGEER